MKVENNLTAGVAEIGKGRGGTMGSLYDIGNFRYKHFTFYSTCGVEEMQTLNVRTFKVDEEI